MMILIMKTDNDVGMDHPSYSKIAIPVAPPAATLFGSKNMFKLSTISSKASTITSSFR